MKIHTITSRFVNYCMDFSNGWLSYYEFVKETRRNKKKKSKYKSPCGYLPIFFYSFFISTCFATGIFISRLKLFF